jgi:hypothetical protein
MDTNAACVLGARFREHEPLAHTIEKANAQARLKLIHLLANGTMRLLQFRRRLREALVASGRFECLQRGQARYSSTQ